MDEQYKIVVEFLEKFAEVSFLLWPMVILAMATYMKGYGSAIDSTLGLGWS
ncbi:24268_t:CDS:2 [Gigaspora margarita]|uniref:24268_t:CDS:1 n=1 Tax=Gigaspora margarita TaxID=4874 RepID=A0ABN7UIN6_GIGMA|nr:24268_t:CDS:2 [Gigaspora margarita]